MRSHALLVLVLATACAKPAPPPVTAAVPAAAAAPAPIAPPPATKKVSVTETFQGVQITDDSRWLEDWSDPAVQQWTRAQDQRAATWLHALPQYQPVKAELAKILGARAPRYFGARAAADRLFVAVLTPPAPQAALEVAPVSDPSALRVLVDPAQVDPQGLTTIDWYVPSPDGSQVAVSLSHGGTESGDLHVYSVATGKEVAEVVPRVNGGTAGGSLAWAPDGKGFYYTRYPRKGERTAADMDFYVQVWFHALGTSPDTDRYEIGKDFPRIAEIQLAVDPNTGHVLATVQKGDGGEFAHYLRAPDGGWTQLTHFGDHLVQAAFSEDGQSIWLLSFDGAPHGKVLRVPTSAPDPSQAETVVPEGSDTLVASFMQAPSIVEHAGRLYLRYQLGGPTTLRAFHLDGTPAHGPQVPDVAFTSSARPLPGGEVLYATQTYTHPGAWYRFDPKTGHSDATPLATRPTADLGDVRVVREDAASADGTEVPVDILLPPGFTKDGSEPCLVYGYGGYGVSLEPTYAARYAPLLDRGLCVAIAHLRGGGELGETWHQQGMLTHKQNVFDDFHGVLQHLVDAGYTAHDRLAILGGSNGGLLMGATVTQHPDDAAVVVSSVGIYDMLHVEDSPNGAFNVTEFGSVKDPDQFRALYAYSPYHRVQDDTVYPPVLLSTGVNDPRVSPWQSRKMAARLQAAKGGPILLRTRENAGHIGAPLQMRIQEIAEGDAFVLDFLAVKPAPATAEP